MVMVAHENLGRFEKYVPARPATPLHGLPCSRRGSMSTSGFAALFQPLIKR